MACGQEEKRECRCFPGNLSTTYGASSHSTSRPSVSNHIQLVLELRSVCDVFARRRWSSGSRRLTNTFLPETRGNAVRMTHAGSRGRTNIVQTAFTIYHRAIVIVVKAIVEADTMLVFPPPVHCRMVVFLTTAMPPSSVACIERTHFRCCDGPNIVGRIRWPRHHLPYFSSIVLLSLCRRDCCIVIARVRPSAHLRCSLFAVFCGAVCLSPGAARRGGSDAVLQGPLARVPRAVEEKPHQVPTPLPALVFRQACPEAVVQEQLERAPGEIVPCQRAQRQKKKDRWTDLQTDGHPGRQMDG